MIRGCVVFYLFLFLLLNGFKSEAKKEKKTIEFTSRNWLQSLRKKLTIYLYTFWLLDDGEMCALVFEFVCSLYTLTHTQSQQVSFEIINALKSN